MEATGAKNYTILAASIIVAAVIIAGTVFVAFGGSESTKTVDVTLPQTITTSTSSSTGSTTCTIPDSGELLITAMNSSSVTPIGSVPVQVENYYPNCFTYSLTTMDTNASGMISIGGIGDYNLTVSYDHATTFVNTYIGPGTLTCVALDLPSGSFDVSHSQGGESNCDTSTTTTSTATTFTSTRSQLYNVTFQQEGACSPAVYVLPWSVTLGNTTEAQPPNTPLPVPDGGYSAGPEPPGLYTITFSVPNGVYQYSLRPQGAFYSYNGTVTVSDSDLMVTLNGPAVSCTTVTSGG